MRFLCVTRHPYVRSWDLHRLECAAGELRKRLAPIGLTLVGGHERMRVGRRAGLVDPEQLAALARGAPVGGAADADVANVVWSALFLEERLRLATDLVLTKAYRQGLVRVSEDGDYQVADAVAFSLMLDED